MSRLDHIEKRVIRVHHPVRRHAGTPKCLPLVSQSTVAGTNRKKRQRLTLLLLHQLLLLLLLLLLHRCLGRQMAHRMRIRRTTRHALSSHLARHPAHLPTRMLSAHPDRPIHTVRTLLHRHHRAGLTHVRLAGAGDARMAHLLHLRRWVHGMTGCHGRVAMRVHAGLHACCRLVCCHHLAIEVALVSSDLPVFFVRYPIAAVASSLSHRPGVGRAAGSRCPMRCMWLPRHASFLHHGWEEPRARGEKRVEDARQGSDTTNALVVWQRSAGCTSARGTGTRNSEQTKRKWVQRVVVIKCPSKSASKREGSEKVSAVAGVGGGVIARAKVVFHVCQRDGGGWRVGLVVVVVFALSWVAPNAEGQVELAPSGSRTLFREATRSAIPKVPPILGS